MKPLQGSNTLVRAGYSMEADDRQLRLTATGTTHAMHLAGGVVLMAVGGFCVAPVVKFLCNPPAHFAELHANNPGVTGAALVYSDIFSVLFLAFFGFFAFWGLVGAYSFFAMLLGGRDTLLLDRTGDQVLSRRRKLCALSDLRRLHLVRHAAGDTGTALTIRYELASDPQSSVHDLLGLGSAMESEAIELARRLADFAGVELTLPPAPGTSPARQAPR